MRLPAIVLAGERAGGNALARACGLPAGVLVPVAGKPCLTRVLETLRASAMIEGGIVVGPTADIVASDAMLQALFAAGDFRWLEPARGPSASALQAATSLDRYPLLLTAGDHALLETAVVDRFCTTALASAPDFIVGLVPYALVQAQFPQSRRTILKFSDGEFCGSNLFLIRTAAGRAALDFWRTLEMERKRPWRIAGRLGPHWLLRYLAGTLSVDAAFKLLSERSGCHIGFVPIDSARTAVDVDTLDDLHLAEQVLAGA